MKLILWTITLVTLLAACRTEKSWQVSGEWKEGEGKTVYLMKFVENAWQAVDSAIVQQGKYCMTGTLERMDRYTLKVGNYQAPLFLDDQPIVGYWGQSKYDSTALALAVKGSREQELVAAIEEFSTARMLGRMFGMGGDALAEYDLAMKPVVDSSLSLYTCALFLEELLSTTYPFDLLRQQYESLAPEVKASWMGVSLAEKIAAEQHIRVGGTAAAIELTDPEGRVRKLVDLRGKCVIVDFWASWCGPCHKKFPELKALYDAYHDAGLEIYGVSLDDKKEAWTKAIADLQLPWVHVSSLKGWECPVAKAYKVTGIPKMFVLDKEGVIVGIDLPEQELRAKLDVLLNNK